MKTFPTEDKLFYFLANSEKCANVLLFLFRKNGYSSYISEIGEELGIGTTLANEYIRYLERAKIVEGKKQKGTRGIRMIYSVSPPGLAKFWGWLWRNDSRLALEVQNTNEKLKKYEVRVKNPKDKADRVALPYLVKQLKVGQKDLEKVLKQFFKVIDKLEKNKLLQRLIVLYLENGYIGLYGKGLTLRVMLYNDFRHVLPFVLQGYKLEELSGKKAELYKTLIKLIHLETMNERISSVGNVAFYKVFGEG